jgi:O-antigen biosynthesis protein
MKLSVVIVNYNVKHFLEQCLHSVEKALQNLEGEVFVVDNNSVDGSNGMVVHKFPWVKLIANKQNLGFSKANNQAIRQATGEYILLLNPDTVVEEDTFEKIVAFMDEHPEAGGLGVKMIDGRGNFLPESKRGLPTPWVAFYKIFGISALFPQSRRFGKYHVSYLNENETHEVDVLAGAFMLMRKAALDKVGLLDEDYFMYGEDIDLSYRITLGGYKNFYYPGTTIIHYKGESTKKGSLNYVRMFYNAMIIFARKHFSKKYASVFSIFIHLAIYFRAMLATVHRLIKRIWLPLADFAAIYLGFLLLYPYWEKVRFEPGYYSDELIYIAVPLYIFSWLVAVYYSGGYERPVSLPKIYKGMAAGTLFVLVAYSLLPESARFSRAIIVLGAALSVIILTLVRFVLHFVVKRDFTLGSHKLKRVAIVGRGFEGERVAGLLQQTGIKTHLIGLISVEADEQSEQQLGNISQIEEIVRVHQLEELIFCSEDVSSQQVIKTMLDLVHFNLEYKIAPPASVSIIGSNSIDTAGDLYVVNENAISREKNLRQKRLFDVVVSMGLLLFSPLLIWFVPSPIGFFRNVFAVLFRRMSWVGYHKVETSAYLMLPAIRKGVLTTTDALDEKEVTPATIDRVNSLYARDYKVSLDFEIVIKAFRKLGQRS